jgi:FkbM family methyltransferase
MKMDTRHKIFFATVAYRFISFLRRCFGKDDHIRANRGGIIWDLDLYEGIDFSIFLLGGFEPGTLKLYKKLLGHAAGEVVLDIGANIGSHTLPLAQLVVPKGGKVYAFEPTQYAFEKLIRNIALNPSIGRGVEAVQAMLLAKDGVAAEQEIYSSWPLENTPNLHADHRGQLKTTSGAQAFSLDSFVNVHDIKRVDFIKLDVDGHEPDVLAGSWLSLERFHPTILMEWSPHIFAERPEVMQHALARLLELGYGIFDGETGMAITGGHEELDRRTPGKGSMNILLRFHDKA